MAGDDHDPGELERCVSSLAALEILTLMLGFLLAVAVARRVGGSEFSRALTGRGSHSWILPVSAALATMLVYAWIWPGGLNPPPTIHDEAAYLFQAELFASLRWTARQPPLPEFFEQFHLLVHGTFASKYPPGHSLLLSPGVAIQSPALVVLLLTGLTAFSLVCLVRQLAGPGAAVIAWGFWLGSSLNLRWFPTYFSEVTTSLVYLAGWYFLLRWWRGGGSGWLVALAVVVGWGAITRPFTITAYAAPLIPVVILRTWQTRQWLPLLRAIGAGLVVLSILPLWAARTTGNWYEWPVTRYTLDYLPFDRPGFNTAGDPPLRKAPEVMSRMFEEFEARHAEHTPELYLAGVGERIGAVRRATWSGWRKWVAPLAIIGLVILGWPGVLGVSVAGGHFLAYGLYAHQPSWTLYYLELSAVGAILTGVGVSWLGSRLAVATSHNRVALRLEPAALTFALAFLPAIAWFATSELPRWRQAHLNRVARNVEVGRAVRSLPDERLLVFVRYPENYVPHDTFVRNIPNLESARVWFIHDRGDDNARLLSIAPDRAPYLLDVRTLTVEPLLRATP